jgi:hypothetical protein
MKNVAKIYINFIILLFSKNITSNINNNREVSAAGGLHINCILIKNEINVVIKTLFHEFIFLNIKNVKPNAV